MKALIVSTLCVLVTISSGRVISQDLWSQLGRQSLQHEPSVFVGQQPRILVNPNLNVEGIVPIVSGQIEELPLGVRVEGQQGLYQQVPVFQGQENVLSGQQIDLERQYNEIQRSSRLNPFVPRWGQGYQQQVGVWGLQVPVEQGQWVQDYELGVLGQHLRQPQVWYGRHQGLLGHRRLSVQSGLRSVVPQTGRVQIGVQEQISPLSVVQGGRIVPQTGRVQIGVQEQISPLSVVQGGRIVPVGQDRLVAQAIGGQGFPVRQYQRLYEVPQVGGLVQQVNGVPVIFQGTQGQQVRVESVLRQEQQVPVQVGQVRVDGVQIPIVGEIPQVQQVRVRSEVNQEQGLPVHAGRVTPIGVQEEQNAIPISEGVQQVHVRSEVRQEQGRAVPLGVQGIQEELNQVPIVEQVRRSVPQGVQEVLAEQIFQNQGPQGVQGVVRPIVNVDLPVYQTYGRGLLSRSQVPYGQVGPRVWDVQHGLGQWSRPVYGQWGRPVYGGLVGVQA